MCLKWTSNELFLDKLDKNVSGKSFFLIVHIGFVIKIYKA